MNKMRNDDEKSGTSDSLRGCLASDWPPCCITPPPELGLCKSTEYFSSFEEWMSRFELQVERQTMLFNPNRQDKLQRFKKSFSCPEARGKHEAYMKKLGVLEEEALLPVIPAGTDCFNPMLDRFWEPWAR